MRKAITIGIFKLKIASIILLVSALSISSIYAQNKILKGFVTDGKEPLIGVTVLIDSLGIGTVTDYEGKFTISNLANGEYKLVFRYLGFEKYEKYVTISNDVTELEIGEIVLTETATALEEVTVSVNNTKGSETKAFDMMKTSLQAINVISSESIKKMPDKNVADALKRANSTNVQNNKGEGSYVSLRGTPNEWTATLINGNRLPVSDEENTSRAFDFEVLPSQMVDYMIISRTTSPDMEGDNIGGYINLISKTTAYERTVALNAGIGYNASAQKPIYNLDFTYGNRTKNKKFGYILNTAYYGRYYGAQAQKLIYGYNTNQGIRSMHLKNYQGLRNTVGINTGFEYRPTTRIKLEGRFIYSTMIDDKYQQKILFNYSEGAGSRVRLQNIHGKLLRSLIGGELLSDIYISEKLKLSVSLTSYASKFQYGNVPFSKNDSRSSDNGYYYVEYSSPLVGYADVDCIDFWGNPTDCNATDKVVTKLIGSDNPYGKGDDPNNIQPVIKYYDLLTGDSTLTPSQFVFSEAYSELNSTWEKDPITARLDLKYDVNDKIFLQFGAKSRFKEGSRQVSLTTWQQDIAGKRSEPYYLTDFNTEGFSTVNPFLNEMGANYSQYNYPFLDRNTLNNFNNILGDTLKEYKINQFNNSYYLWVGNSYTYKENIHAAYAMFGAKPSDKWYIGGGLRVEYTDVTVSADTLTNRTGQYYDVIGKDSILKYYSIPESRTINNQYFSFLPSVNINYKIKDNSNLRLGISRSMHRPNFNELKPGDYVYNLEEQQITYGNPKLNPAYSWNFDLIYEYFFGDKGVISGGLYYKQIKDHIFAYSGSGQDVLSGIVIKKFSNVNSSYVMGAEFLIERQLDFLPGFLGGLGVGVNGTYSFSRMKVPGRDKKQSMTEQTPIIANFKLFYNKYGVNATVAFNYTGRYLHELNLFEVKDQEGNIITQKDNHYDVFHDHVYSLDFQGGYDFKNHFSVYVQFNNLLNRPHRMYRGEVFRTQYTEYYRWKGQIGFKYNL